MASLEQLKLWLFGPKKPEDSAAATRDFSLGARYDRGRGQDIFMRLDKDEKLDKRKGALADPKLLDKSAQRALVEEIEREFDRLPEEVKAEIAGDLTVAKNAIARGEKIPPLTVSHLAQVKAEQDTRTMLKGLLAGVPVSSADLGIRGGEPVNLAMRLTHGLDSIMKNPNKAPAFGLNFAAA